jgi:hypothetical protein
MADDKHIRTVSRTEFYSTVASLLLMPAVLFMIVFSSVGAEAGERGLIQGFSSVLQMIVGWFLVFAMMGLSLAYSILAIRERARETRAKNETASP